jgi:hypothetical protein
MRIESYAFSSSSLQSIVIPRNVQFIDGSAFNDVSISSISIESGNEIFVVEKEFLIDIVHHKLIRNFSTSSNLEIGSDFEIVGSSCFSSCKSLLSISFESNSRLTRIESQAFHGLDVVVVVPSTIMFIACDAFGNVRHISIADGDFCQEFDHWRELRTFGIAVDFRRILRFGCGLHDLKDYEINVRIVEAVSVLSVFDRILSERYLRREDDLVLIVKSMPRCKSMEGCVIELELDKLLNLRHPCIAAPIGFVFPDELSESRELKIVRLHVEGISLAEMISMSPVWWTATAKAKTVAGIVLGIRFAHSLGLIHGHLNSRNLFFDSDDRIEITNFGVMDEDVEENESDSDAGVGGFSGARWSPKIDIEGFVSILIEIIVGHPATQSDASNSQMIFPTDVPGFVLEMISANRSADRGISESFNNIFDFLKENDFQILSGVDSVEVWKFITWIERLEY